MGFFEELDPDIRRIAQQQEGSVLYRLLDAWYAAMDQRLLAAEKAVIADLSERIYPSGDWRYPMQSVVVPEPPFEEEIRCPIVCKQHPFTLYSSGDQEWIPGGNGHLLPVEGGAGKAYWWDKRLSLVWDLKPTASGYTLFKSPASPSLLGFAAAAEPLMEALLAGSWAVQNPEMLFTAMQVARYEGYLEFERSLGQQRSYQRHLEHFLPGFYPYARKFLEFRAPDVVSEEERLRIYEERRHLGVQNHGASIRLSFLSSPDTPHGVLEALYQGAQTLLHVNAVPIYQMQVERPNVAALQNKIVQRPIVIHPFFATASGESKTQPCSLLIADAVPDTEAQLPEGAAWATIEFSDKCSAASLFFKCFGDEARLESNAFVSRDSGRRVRFRAVADAVGGASIRAKMTDTAGKPSYLWEQSALYPLQFRPETQTLGDIAHLLRSVPAARIYLDSDALELSFEERIAGPPDQTPWSNYLWPSVQSERTEAATVDLSSSARPHTYLLPTLCFHLRLKPATRLPAFLKTELESYMRSVLAHFIGGATFVETVIQDAEK